MPMLTIMLATSAGLALQPAASSPPRPGTPPRLIEGSISNADYPPAAITAGQEGAVRITLDLSATGAVTACRVVESSGSAALDQASCQVASTRFRFSPGRNAQGQAAPSSYTQRVRWVLPEDQAAWPFAAFSTEITGTYRDAVLQACTIRDAGPRRTAPDSACDDIMPPSFRTAVDSATSVLAFTPAGTPSFTPGTEAGSLIVRYDHDLVIAADGRVGACTRRISQGPGLPPVADQGPACSPDRLAQRFVPDPTGRERRGTLTIGLYVVRIGETPSQ